MTVTVRMYDVGFGDCFLVMGGPEPRWRMLIDCGCHPSSAPARGGTIQDAARRVIADCRDEDGQARIDVVVVSHRHADHIAGFDLPDWKDVKVGAVLLPWTEDPDDPEARRIHDAQAHLAKRVTRLAVTPRRAPLVADLLAFASNADAMRTVHGGFRDAVKPRFLAGDLDRPPLALDPLPGVAIHVLGPARDEATIRDMDPPAGQSYLRVGPGDLEGEPPLQPFADTHSLPLGPDDEARLDALQAAIGDDALELAVALDKAVNGTSLVLAVEVEGQVLLFPGDAQWGTWDRVLGHRPWAALVARTTFLKVGHHGSHNATPKRLVDGVLPDGIPAMISVRSMRRWPEIPREPLLDRFIEKRIAWVQSDGGSRNPPALVRQADDGAWWEIDLP